MYSGPFAQFSPFAPNYNPFFFQTSNPAFFHPNFNVGSNPGFTPGFPPQAGSYQGPFQGQYPAQSPGQYPGNTGTPAGSSGWSPIVTQTSDGFSPTGGYTNGTPTAGTNFTPYSYNQPFFPGYTGIAPSPFNATTPNPGSNPWQGHNFGPTGQPFGQQPAFSAAPGWWLGGLPGGYPGVFSAGYPASYWPGAQAPIPAWNGFGVPTAFGGFGGNPANAFGTNFYPAPATNGGFPSLSLPYPGFPSGGFQGGGFQGNGFGSSGYNGYTTFPFITNTTPGFPAWNQSAGGFPYWGAPGPFLGSFNPGSFNPGAGSSGWFPGQATFPWYSQVNAAPYGPTAATPTSRPGENSDAANQPPRGIQFNRDAA